MDDIIVLVYEAIQNFFFLFYRKSIFYKNKIEFDKSYIKELNKIYTRFPNLSLHSDLATLTKNKNSFLQIENTSQLISLLNEIIKFYNFKLNLKLLKENNKEVIVISEEIKIVLFKNKKLRIIEIIFVVVMKGVSELIQNTKLDGIDKKILLEVILFHLSIGYQFENAKLIPINQEEKILFSKIKQVNQFNIYTLLLMKLLVSKKKESIEFIEHLKKNTWNESFEILRKLLSQIEVSQKEKVEVFCLNCFTFCKVPNLPSKIKITCPKCKSKWEWKTNQMEELEIWGVWLENYFKNKSLLEEENEVVETFF